MSRRDITSTDWHLEGVSVEARRLVAAYAQLCGLPQGRVVEQALREYLSDKLPQPKAWNVAPEGE
jgi:hypothetical protein